MEWWKIFWLIVLVLSFVSFWGIAVVVAYKGFFDLKDLFRHMMKLHQQPQDQ